MQLKLKRSQRLGGVLGGTYFFMLDARADLTETEKAAVTKYKLASMTLYSSEAAKGQVAKFESSMDSGSYLKAFARAAMSRLSLNITIGSLMNGHHIECKDLGELLGAEEAVMDGCKAFLGYLKLAETFDGREVVIDINDQPKVVAAA